MYKPKPIPHYVDYTPTRRFPCYIKGEYYETFEDYFYKTTKGASK